MGLLNEYIQSKKSANDLENELQLLALRYSAIRNVPLFIYASAIDKPIPDVALRMDDYYVIYDMLRNSTAENLDLYIETPGGSGEAAEEIAEWLHKKFKAVCYVISGEAKSAGTILALSGNDIFMTDSGSLGPIDAQMKIGRSTVSAYDYMFWIEEKMKDAMSSKSLNPVDATIIAQISPGEIYLVDNAKKFALDLVKEWLPKYKFSQWNLTETKKDPVTPQMKKEAATKVADALVDHSAWRSHGRSIKIDDLHRIGLKVNRIDEKPELAEIVYRIQTIIRVLFSGSSYFKMFVTHDQKIFRGAVLQKAQAILPPDQKPTAMEMQVNCPQCGKVHNLYMKLVEDPVIDMKMKEKGARHIPVEKKITCDCGFLLELSGIINEFESKTGQKLI